MTATVHSGVEQRALNVLAAEWTLDRSCEGYVCKRWHWNGYDGETTDGISYGTRPDGMMVRLSGSMAVRHWLTTLYWSHNVSRFDIQTTILSEDERSDHAHHGQCMLALDTRVASGAVTTKYIEDTPQGSSLYVGSRASDRMLRMYNKTAESEGEYPKTSWRYEIEYKGVRAYRVAQRIKGDRHPTQAIFDCLQAVYTDWGLGIPADRPAWAWRDAGVAHVTDDQRRLEWLGRCIRPVVLKLSEAYGVDEVLSRLGITANVDESTGLLDYEAMLDAPQSIT